jgi:hypothetical protein
MHREREKDRFAMTRPEPAGVAAEESLVTDARAGLTPAQMVERKLVSLLPTTSLPIGHRHETVRRALS